MVYSGRPKGVFFRKLSEGSETSDMTSDELGEMFEGDSADTYAGDILLVLDLGARTPIGPSGIFILDSYNLIIFHLKPVSFRESFKKKQKKTIEFSK